MSRQFFQKSGKLKINSNDFWWSLYQIKLKRRTTSSNCLLVIRCAIPKTIPPIPVTLLFISSALYFVVYDLILFITANMPNGPPEYIDVKYGVISWWRKSLLLNNDNKLFSSAVEWLEHPSALIINFLSVWSFVDIKSKYNREK